MELSSQISREPGKSMPDIDKKGIFGYFGGGLPDKVAPVRASGDLDANLTQRGSRGKSKVLSWAGVLRVDRMWENT